MLGRLRVLLIVAGLAAVPVTADLHHGFVWSEASAQGNFQVPVPLYWAYPWCTFYKYKNYESGKWHNYYYRLVEGTPVGDECARTTCLRQDWCISEFTNWAGYPFLSGHSAPTKIKYGCVREICIAIRALNPPP